MDKTLNKVLMAFVILVVFDATAFTIEKTRFSLFSSVVHVVGTVKDTINLVK